MSEGEMLAVHTETAGLDGSMDSSGEISTTASASAEAVPGSVSESAGSASAGSGPRLASESTESMSAESTPIASCAADPYATLRLENQLCFPLYAAAKEVVRRYKPLLDAIDLTYTQYIAMMVLWSERELNVSELGERLYLDSGTLTPLLKKLEDKGYVERRRAERDRRELRVALTERGAALRDEALAVPRGMAGCVDLSTDEAAELYRLLYKVLAGLTA